MLKAEKEFIDPKNLSFIFLNILIFIIVQILFFYYIASGQYEEVVVGLSSLPIAYLEKAPLERDYYCKESDPSLQQNKDIKEKAEEEKVKNQDFNKKLILKYFTPVFVVLFFIILILFIIMFIKREKFIKADSIIFFTIIAAFSTELYYYFVIVRQMIFVGEQQIISEIISPYSTFEYTSPLPNLYTKVEDI